MLLDIIETKNFDFKNYRELKKYCKFLSREEFHEIIDILKTLFEPNIYIEPRQALKTIELCPLGDGPSKFIHGVYHVEKVFIYCYLMVKMNNICAAEEGRFEDIITEEYAKILYYAAFYHDIGRVDNSESNDHGFNSGKIFNKLFSNVEFFRDRKDRMYLTECLMTNHSEKIELTDEKSISDLVASILYEHDEDWENTKWIVDAADNKFVLLCNILKDADALDRKRFGEWQRASLNVEYLRTPYARDLIAFADELNKLYYARIKSNYGCPNFRNFISGDGFHSIGFDFFKIRTILKYGILSQDELEAKSIQVPRNFPGGNFDRWVSVVDVSLYPDFVAQMEHEEENNKKLAELISECGYSFDCKSSCFAPDQKLYAAGNFTHHGITFLCSDIMFTLPEINRDKALETGMPWNKSNYVDEKYVYQKINPESIIGLFIPIECINSDIKSLRYIYESTNMDIVRARVLYYLGFTEALPDDPRIQVLNELIDEYEVLTIEELSKETGCNSKEYFEESNRIITCINTIIGQFVYEYYKNQLNTPVFNIKDVVVYELRQLRKDGFRYKMINLKETTSRELFFKLFKQKHIRLANPKVYKIK
jgi:hypothetical protein